MLFFPAILCSLLGLATTWVLIPVILRRFSWMGERSKQLHHSHKIPVPRLGGLALAAAFVFIALAVTIFFPPTDGTRIPTRLTIIFTSLAMFLLGFWDDIRPLGARKKLLGQILIAMAAFYCGIQIQSFKNPLTHTVYELGPLAGVVTVFWLVALTNLINLIDGIDGLAAGIGLMLMGLLTYVGFTSGSFTTYAAAGMCGALLGFLYYNFPPAKIYLGDGGAYFIGYLIAIFTVSNSQKGAVVAALIAPIFALALPIIDVTLAILRRGMKGLPIFRPDRKHIHHRLVEMGYSRVRSVLVLYGLSLVFLVLAFAIFASQGKLLPFVFGMMCLTLLVAAGSIRFAREWFSVGRVVGNSMEMRKETRYALCMRRWLELEAERCDSLEELWTDFKFLARKSGFSRITLQMVEGPLDWQIPGDPASSVAPHVLRHDLQLDSMLWMELEAPPNVMHQRLFELMSELTAETWLKAAQQWRLTNEAPVRFLSQKSPAEALPAASYSPA